MLLNPSPAKKYENRSAYFPTTRILMDKTDANV